MKLLLLSPAPALAAPAAPLALASTLSLGQRAGRLLQQLHQGSPALAWAGWLHVGLALLAAALLFFDPRLLTGAPVWAKPLKFALADGLFCWTMAVLLLGLPAAARPAVAAIGWGVALSMMVETVIIFVQAGRGQPSHYNVSSALNAALFATMGIFILVNTLCSLWAVYVVWRYPLPGPAAYGWGVRLGLPLSVLGALVGGLMIRQLAHTVGAPDGGPGLPGLGWSTRAGDVRAAHFLGLHAVQALPLLGWALGRGVPASATVLTWLGAGLYLAAAAALLAQALAGQPLWRGR
ncbi:MAG TPA: hypothetical protein VFO93_02040 [Hymenobacter sp.]|uniref:hypothetical protein n=1 Tax=Hymenobacter sp. TaxID=1898978 RepID=UPI002D7F8EA3|nr:hypothetical protein [Hymenobacter sp.]HET9502292.1 hypothetical protein [Hymenobacter sp.]